MEALTSFIITDCILDCILLIFFKVKLFSRIHNYNPREIVVQYI